MSLWPACVSRLKSKLPDREFGMWIQPLQAGCEAGQLRLYAPNAFVLEWVRKNYFQQIHELLEGLCGVENVPEVTFSVGSLPLPSSAGATRSTGADSRHLARHAAERIDPETPPEALSELGATKAKRIRPHLTFESFVAGECNQLALSASEQISKSLGKIYNPLFLYGQSGLGKTHLLHAIGNAVLVDRPQTRLLYVHSERFLQSMISAFHQNRVAQFRKQYRDLDLILLDDVQFFSKKSRTQEEFLHLFNQLLEQKSQIVLASDRAPHHLLMGESLVSRLSAGLSVELKPPTTETRARILQAKAALQGVELPEEVALLMAERARNNVRELEGALTRVLAGAQFRSVPVTAPFAESILQGWSEPQSQLLPIEVIQRRVAEQYQIPFGSLLSPSRSRSVAQPRQVAMALAKELSSLSLSEIGREFGGRDHTTVLYACRKVAEKRKSDRSFYALWMKLRRSLT